MMNSASLNSSETVRLSVWHNSETSWNWNMLSNRTDLKKKTVRRIKWLYSLNATLVYTFWFLVVLTKAVWLMPDWKTGFNKTWWCACYYHPTFYKNCCAVPPQHTGFAVPHFRILHINILWVKLDYQSWSNLVSVLERQFYLQY